MAGNQTCLDKTLFVSDLDGTLLTTRECISERSLAVINGLLKKGIHFTYATARSLNSAKKVTEGLYTDMPVIVYNGTFIRNAGSGEILYSCAFTEEEQRNVQRIVKKNKIYPLVYAWVREKNPNIQETTASEPKCQVQNSQEKVSWHTEYENEGMLRYIHNRRGDSRLRPVYSEEDLFAGEAFYYTCIGEREELLPVYEAFRNDRHYTCTLQQELYRPEYWCEIMPRRATKAGAVEQLKRMEHCDRVICFGDAVNDLPMFRQSDEAYAVANAVEELKREATDIIGGNDEDAVALWLERYMEEN